MRVLVVEDEPHIRKNLKALFESKAYRVDDVDNFDDALYFAQEYPIDIAIVDLTILRGDGIDLVEQIRRKGKTFPIIILTSRDQWQEKVLGFEVGADDYVTKPFVPEELMARAQAQLRRAHGFEGHIMKAGPIQINLREETVHINEKSIELTAYEYKLLEYMVLNAGKLISKIELTEHLYAQDFERDSNVIEVFMGRLRRKLDPDNNYQPIETQRGRGYRFSLETEHA